MNKKKKKKKKNLRPHRRAIAGDRHADCRQQCDMVYCLRVTRVHINTAVAHQHRQQRRPMRLALSDNVQHCARVGTAQLTHNNTAIDKRLQHIGAQRSGIAQPTVVKTSPGLDQHQCASLVFVRYRNSQRSASTLSKRSRLGPAARSTASTSAWPIAAAA
jgi:hypothetical protein